MALRIFYACVFPWHLSLFEFHRINFFKWVVRVWYGGC